MYLLWLASTAGAMFALVVAPDVLRFFDLDEMAFDLARYMRRKWRQQRATWREIWRTNWT